jgi:AcrR family transcriptional regulator
VQRRPAAAPGRPRSAEADRAILATALRLLVEQGYDRLSIDGVAAAAGVGKPTIYRRYATKRDLVIAAVSSLAAEMPEPPDTGDLRADLFTFLRQTFEVFRSGVGFAMMGTVLVKEREDPELLQRFREAVLLPRLEMVARLLRRGIARGTLRPDFPVEVAIQMAGGAVFARHVAGQPEDEAWMRVVIDTLWTGIEAR